MSGTILWHSHCEPYILQQNANANGNGTPARLNGIYGSLTVQVIGAGWTGVINFEASIDGTNWIAIQGHNLNSGALVTSTSTPGIFVFQINGIAYFRARQSGYTAGNVTVLARATPVSIAGLSAATINATVDSVKITDATGTYRLAVDASGNLPVQLTGSIESMTSAPVVGVKTVTSTAAEIFAGSSTKPNRQKLILKNEDPVLRFRIGPSTVTQQNGFPIEPGAVVEIQFNPSTAVPVYAISEGVSLQVAVMEI